MEKLIKTKADQKKYLNYPTSFSAIQEDVLMGCLLGDGCIAFSPGRYNCFSFEQTKRRKEYVEYIFNILNPFNDKTEVKKIFKSKLNTGIFGKKDYHGFAFRTMRHPLFTKLKNEWYVNGNVKKAPKKLPENLTLNWRIVSFWFADDGCMRPDRKEIVLSCQSFTKQDNLKLLKLLENLNIKGSLSKRNTITISRYSFFEFIENVSLYLKDIDCLKYKINIENSSRLTLKFYSVEEKLNAINLLNNGVSINEVSKIIGSHPTTIKRWRKKYETFV